MQILVFNSGSSSLKFELFTAAGPEKMTSRARGIMSRFGPEAFCTWTINGQSRQIGVAISDHHEAAAWIIGLLKSASQLGALFADTSFAVGHRVVHGGDLFSVPVRITDAVIAGIASLESLAPLHNSVSVQVMRACQLRLGPDLPMVAVFDTAFHQTLPPFARAYALPADWTVPFGIKRYGFHGIAHRYLYERYLQISGTMPETGRVITLQLGQGCSITAIRGGSPVETSMGFTPLEGLIMATRPGDVDAGILLHLAAQGGLSPDQLRDGLNHRSGLLGLSGLSADMQELLRLKSEEHAGATLAIDAFCHRVRKYLGAYLAVLGGADAVVFGGGIGEHAPHIRARICANMNWCGLALDPKRNDSTKGIESEISAEGSACRVYVIPVDEESIIARETYLCLHPEGQAK